MGKKKELIISIAVAVITFALFLTLALIIYYNNGELAIDNSIRDAIYNIRGEKNNFAYYLFRIITEFGYLYVAIAIGIIGIIYTGIDRGLVLYVFGFLLEVTLNAVLKTAFDRERPMEAMRWMSDDESSFPSGHSATVAFLYPYITYYLFKNKKQNWLKFTSLGVTIVIIPLVLLSRLILGMHYFTDVIAGTCIGLFSCSITVMVYLLLEKYDLFTKGLINFFGKKHEKNIKD